MSETRQQVWIDAPKQTVWELIADIERHAEWWPRVIDVECEGVGEACTYRQVTQTPFGKDEMHMHIDRFDDPRELKIRCLSTGTFFQLALTDAQGGTFIDARAGMESPQKFGHKAFDALVGKRYFMSWLAASLEAMDRVACERARAAAAG